MDQENFSETLARTARTLRSQPDMQHTLQAAVDLAAQHLRGRAEVSVSMVMERRRIETPAATNERAVKADELQYELSEGPCLDAIWEHETFQIADLEQDQHYPRWSRRVAALCGFRGIVSYQLFTDTNTLGALNVYTPDPHPYDAVDRAEGLLFATHAALALQAARTERDLNSALLTRNIIGQAQGILMERYRLSAERAFEFLSRTSQESNIKVVAVSRQLIASISDSADPD